MHLCILICIINGGGWGGVTPQNNQIYQICIKSFGPRREKPCLRGVANNTGANQPAHPRSLISVYVIRFLESTICKFATGEISIF